MVNQKDDAFTIIALSPGKTMGNKRFMIKRNSRPKKSKKKRSGRDNSFGGPDTIDARKTRVDKNNLGGVTLNKNREFYYRYTIGERLIPARDKLFDELFPDRNFYMIDKRKEVLSILLANLFRPVLIRTFRIQTISIYRRKGVWGKKTYYDISDFILDLMDEMEAAGYIESRLGSKYEGPNEEAYKTRIWATKKLIEFFKPTNPTLEDLRLTESKELIELKSIYKYDDKGKIEGKYKKRRLIEYSKDRNTDHTNRLRRELTKLNILNGKANIKLFSENKLIDVDFETKAVFSERFDWHGRVYATGYNNFQKFSEDDRKTIKINGEPVVEWDYAAFHPRLLYAIERIQFDLNGDPYHINGINDEARPLLKHMFVAMLNCKNYYVAKASCEKWLNFKNDNEKYNKRNLHKLSPKQIKYYNNVLTVQRLGVSDPKPLMKKFIETHSSISKYLMKGDNMGIKLMNVDSKIALDICEHFIKKRIPILPIHDSFIVQEQHSTELKRVMHKMFKKHAFGFDCPIK